MYENLKGRKLTKEDKKYFENWILKARKLSEIENIINLEVFKTHPELLNSCVFKKTPKEIDETYLLYCLYKVEEYITSSHILLKSDEVNAKFNYIDSINDNITIETKSGKIKLHPIMLMTNKNMKLNYGITKKELIQNYRYKDADEEDYKINQYSKIKL